MCKVLSYHLRHLRDDLIRKRLLLSELIKLSVGLLSQRLQDNIEVHRVIIGRLGHDASETTL